MIGSLELEPPEGEQERVSHQHIAQVSFMYDTVSIELDGFKTVGDIPELVEDIVTKCEEKQGPNPQYLWMIKFKHSVTKERDLSSGGVEREIRDAGESGYFFINCRALTGKELKQEFFKEEPEDWYNLEAYRNIDDDAWYAVPHFRNYYPFNPKQDTLVDIPFLHIV